jgi:hypothetical protein
MGTLERIHLRWRPWGALDAEMGVQEVEVAIPGKLNQGATESTEHRCGGQPWDICWNLFRLSFSSICMVDGRVLGKAKSRVTLDSLIFSSDLDVQVI